MHSTKICTFNLEESVLSRIKNKTSTIYNGTIGKRINIPNIHRGDTHNCLLNMDFPENLHEYKIFIIDLVKDEPIEYFPKAHQRKYTTGSSMTVLQSSYPATLFDPKPYCLQVLKDEIKSLSKNSIFIVFAESNYEIEYQPAIISNTYLETISKESYSLYDFLDFPISQNSKRGLETKVDKSVGEDLKKILKKHNDDASYFQTFFHPTIVDKNHRKHINDPKFFPLMQNNQDEIISYIDVYENLTLFVFPQFKEKGEFLTDFLYEFIPEVFPETFPQIIKNGWKKEKEYFLPNHIELIKEEEQEKIRHQNRLKEIEHRITVNYNKYSFLHEMLTTTGDDLVKSVIIFLKWLGFENPLDSDIDKKGVLEEDIQIETNRGLIIIEVKGIGGTSKDSECSQINKVKHRRCKERNKFDVYAHYLVNHQRHLPPLKRSNPPFAENQISDSLNEERGLISTWQLYKLYKRVQNGIITKEQAREKFYKYGLIDFKPKCILLGKVEEVFQDGYIAILKIKNTKIMVGDTLLVEKNNNLKLVRVISLKINNVDVKEAENTEVGIKLDQKIVNKSLLYLK